jgi:hypothetical protein
MSERSVSNVLDFDFVKGLFRKNSDELYIGIDDDIFIPIEIEDDKYRINLHGKIIGPLDQLTKIEELNRNMAVLQRDTSHVGLYANIDLDQPEIKEFPEDLDVREYQIGNQDQEVEYEELDELLLDIELEDVDFEEQVVGEKIVTDVKNATKYKVLAPESSSDDITKMRQTNIINLINIANAKLNLSKGELLLKHQGLPSWIIPIISVTKISQKNIYYTDEIKAELYELYTKDGCTIETQVPKPLIHTSVNMVTDNPNEPAGNWLLERQDHTYNVIFKTGEANNGEITKFKANQYDMDIHLKDHARSKMIGKKEKNIYSRLISTPGNIERIDTKNIYSDHIHVVGLLVRPVETPTTQPVDYYDKTLKVSCNSLVDPQTQLAELINSFYKSIPDIISDHKTQLYGQKNLSRFYQILEKYNYHPDEVTVDDMIILKKILESNVSDVDEDWVRNHKIDVILTDKRSSGLTYIYPTFYRDMGYYYYHQQLLEYLKRNHTTKPKMLNQIVGDIDGLIFHDLTDNITVSDQIYYKEDNKWYDKENYNKIKKQQAVDLYNHYCKLFDSIDMASQQEKYDNLRYNFMALYSGDKKFMRAMANLTANMGKTVKDTMSKEAKILFSFDLTDPTEEKYYLQYLNSYIENEIVSEINNFYRIKKTGEIICCKHVHVQISDQDISQLSDNEGKCIYCGVHILDEISKDDFTQLQQSTARDMYITENIDETVNKSNIILEIFIILILDNLDLDGITVTPENIKIIVDDVIEYISNHRPELLDPYKLDDMPSKPISTVTKDLLTGILYDIHADPRNTSTKLFSVERQKGARQSQVLLNKGLSKQVSSYIKEMVGADIVNYFSDLKKLAVKNKEYKKDIFERLNIFTIAMIKPYTIILSIIYYSLIKQIRNDYNRDITEQLLDSFSLRSMIDIMNTYNKDVVARYFNPAIQFLSVASVDNRDLIRDRYERQKKLFEGTFYASLVERYKILGDFDITELLRSNLETLLGDPVFNLTVDDPIEFTSNAKTLAVYQQTYNGIKMPQIESVIDIEEPRTYDEYLRCLGIVYYNSTKYIQDLWYQYALLLNKIDELEIKPTWKTDQNEISLSQIFYMEKMGTSATDLSIPKGQSCFYDSVGSSLKLYDNIAAITDIIGDSAISRNYVENEERIQQHINGNKMELVPIVLRRCHLLWDELQSKKNKGLKKADHFVENAKPVPVITGYNLPLRFKKGSIIDNQKLNKKTKDFDKRFLLLQKYHGTDHHTTALGGIFENNTIISQSIPTNSKNTILSTPQAQKANDRKHIIAYQNIEMPNFNDPILKKYDINDSAWPLPTSNVDYEIEIKRRIIKRKQQIGLMLKKYFRWISSPIDPEGEELWDEVIYSIKDTDIGSNSYTVEHDPLVTTGYISPILYELKKKGVTSLKLNQFNHYIPEIYHMSYSEFKEQVNSSIDYDTFSQYISAAIRLDILMHCKFVINSSESRFVQEIMELPEDINDIQHENYKEFLEKYFSSFYKNNVIDPDRNEIDTIYDVKFLGDIKRRFINRTHLKELGIDIATQNIMDYDEIEEEEDSNMREDELRLPGLMDEPVEQQYDYEMEDALIGLDGDMEGDMDMDLGF